MASAPGHNPIAEQLCETAAAFLLMKTQDETSRHLMINIYRRAVQAGRLVYRAIDGGLFSVLWLHHKPGEGFMYEAVQAPTDHPSKRKRRRKDQTEQLRRIPDAQLTSTHFLIAWEETVNTLTRVYSEAFEAGAQLVHHKKWAKDEHGRVKSREVDGKRKPIEEYDEWDEASKRAWQRHRAGVYADACKLLARLAEDADAEPKQPATPPAAPKANAIYLLGPGQRVRPLGSDPGDGIAITKKQFELLQALETEEYVPLANVMRTKPPAVWLEMYNAQDVEQRKKVQKFLRRLNDQLSAGGLRFEFELSGDDVFRNQF